MKQFLVIRLDQYAGNVDELVCTALTGWGAERYGKEQARKVFDEKLKPLLGDEDYALPIECCCFETEYGIQPYSLDPSSTNNLRLGIDECATEEMIHETLNLWEQAYGKDMTIVVEDVHRSTITIKILGFDLVVVTEVYTPLR